MGVNRIFNEEKTDVIKINFHCDECKKPLTLTEDFTAIRLRNEPDEGKKTTIFVCNECFQKSSLQRIF